MASYTDIVPKLTGSEHVGYGTVTDIDAIKNSLRNLFTIKLGEVPGKPWLGNPLPAYLFDNIGFFEERAMETALRNVIDKFEPRVSLTGITVDNQPEYNSINILLKYVVYIEGIERYQELSLSLVANDMTTIQTRLG